MSETSSKNIILFDGICNLCTWSARFVRRYDPKKSFLIIPFQTDEGGEKAKVYSVDVEMLQSVVLIKNDIVYVKSDAVLEILRELSTPWNHLYFLRYIPKPIRDTLYTIVARVRFLLFGKRKTICSIEEE